MTRRLVPYVLAVAVLAIHGCAVSRQEVTPLGRAVKLSPIPHEGELVAVSADSLWLARDAEIVSVPWSQIERVQFRRSGLTGGKVMAYSTLLGVVTGGALVAACSQVEGTECAPVFPTVLALSLLLGGLSAISIESSAKQTVSAGRWETLGRYARFPQGLPDSLPRRGPAALPP